MTFGLAWSDLAVLVAAYAIGCFATGYYLVRWRTGTDVRRQGTGSVGATNAARMMGKGAFTAVALGDMAKGALAVALGRWLGDAGSMPALAAIAVVVGHLWPAQLGFRGGKGVSTAFGAALVLSPPVALWALAIAALAFAIGCRVVLSGLVGVSLAPVVAVGLGESAWSIGGIAALSVLVVAGHRANIAGMLAKQEPWRRRIRARAENQAPPSPVDGIQS